MVKGRDSMPRRTEGERRMARGGIVPQRRPACSAQAGARGKI